MIKRLYVHNFRCLENFDLSLGDRSSALLIGRNGAGKSTVFNALEVLQQLGRGTTRVSQLVTARDFSKGNTASPMRFDLEVYVSGRAFQYTLAVEHPANFREPRVYEESLRCDGEVRFQRQQAQVVLGANEARFLVDWHLAALPVIQERNENDPLSVFRRWLAGMILLAPIPSVISGESTEGESTLPKRTAENFGAWFSEQINAEPDSINTITNFLRDVFPDLHKLRNPIVAPNARSLSVVFQQAQEELAVPFTRLSDGEKCFLIAALVVAANESRGDVFCFWDEPEAHLALPEVQHFVMALRRTFQRGGQLLVSTHSPEAMRAFSDENTFLLTRESHLEPTRVKPITDLKSSKEDLEDALLSGRIKL